MRCAYQLTALATLAAIALTGCYPMSARDRADYERLNVVKDELDEMGSPLIRSTVVTTIWGDPITLGIRLTPGAPGRVKARAVWCELLLPRDVGRDYAGVFNDRMSWDPPKDCDNPEDFGKAWRR